MRTTVVTLSLYPSSGGPAKSVAAFQRALDAEVVSWADGRLIETEKLIWTKCHVVSAVRTPLLRKLAYPSGPGLSTAEEAIARSDLVSCHLFWKFHAQYGGAMAQRNGVPYWFVPHGALDPYVFESDKIAKWAFLKAGGRRFLERAAAVVCATQREYDKLRHFVPQARPAVIPWPLDESDFRDRDPERRRATRQKLGIGEEAVVFLAFGRLDPMKRPLETIAAFAAGGPSDSHLLLVGNEFGVSRRACEDQAQAVNVRDRVHVIGPAYGAARHDFIDAADVYVSLSRRENFNFTAAEALASGVPVMLSPGNDLSPALQAEGCGWFLNSLNDAAEAFALAGRSSADDRSVKGDNGRRWAEKNLRYHTFESRVRAFAAEVAGLT